MELIKIAADSWKRRPKKNKKNFRTFIHMAHIELRSDTFTKPTPPMLEAMLAAKIGDDVFGEDETTNTLETYSAQLFGYEAALFCTSGTMANQIAIAVHCNPGSEVICDALSHIYLYEGGGIAANAGASVTLLHGINGVIAATQVAQAIKEDNVHYPITTLVSVENTVNKGGGNYYEIDELQAIKDICVQHKLPLHCDGARLMNALVASKQTPIQHGAIYDTVTVCLSKGLGAPMGTVLLGTKHFIAKAKRVRKRFGGGWRQSGYMAACGLYALQHQVNRLTVDHTHAKVLAAAVSNLPSVASILPVHTNIVILQLKENYSSNIIVEQWKQLGIYTSPFGPDKIRLVTHLDVSEADVDFFTSVIK